MQRGVTGPARETELRGQGRKADAPHRRVTLTEEAVEGEEPWDGRVVSEEKARSREWQAVERSVLDSGDGGGGVKR